METLILAVPASAQKLPSLFCCPGTNYLSFKGLSFWLWVSHCSSGSWQILGVGSWSLEDFVWTESGSPLTQPSSELQALSHGTPSNLPTLSSKAQIWLCHTLAHPSVAAPCSSLKVIFLSLVCSILGGLAPECLISHSSHLHTLYSGWNKLLSVPWWPFSPPSLDTCFLLSPVTFLPLFHLTSTPDFWMTHLSAWNQMSLALGIPVAPLLYSQHHS